MSYIPIIATFSGIGGVISGVVSRIVGVLRTVIGYIRVGIRRIVNFFERIVRSNFWERVVRLVQWLSNPQNALAVVTGISALMVGIAEISKVLEEYAKQFEDQLQKLRINIYNALMSEASDYWKRFLLKWSQYYANAVKAVQSLPFIGSMPMMVVVLSSVVATVLVLSDLDAVYDMFMTCILKLFAYLANMVLAFFQGIVAFMVRVFAFFSYVSSYYAIYLVQFIIIPLAIGLAMVRMYTRGLWTLPTTIGQPVEVGDRGFGFLMFSLLYPLALFTAQVWQWSTMIVPYKPTIPTIPTVPITHGSISMMITESESLAVNVLVPTVKPTTIVAKLSESEKINVKITGVAVPPTYTLIRAGISEGEKISVEILSKLMYGVYAHISEGEIIYIHMLPISYLEHATALVGPISIGYEFVNHVETSFVGPVSILYRSTS